MTYLCGAFALETDFNLWSRGQCAISELYRASRRNSPA